MKKTTTIALFAGAVSLVGSTFARNQNISMPEATAFPDTESSLTQPFFGWDEKTRHFLLTFEVVRTNTESSCVQCAFGTDTNGDEDLEPEETDLVLGIDCGEPFARDERNETPYRACLTPGMVTTSPCDAGREGTPGTAYTFDLSRIFDRAWNRVKVTTRNLPTNVVASIIAQFKNNPTLIILR